MTGAGKILVIAGFIIVIIGLIVWLGGNYFNWLGKLPGDIRIERENFRFYFPLTTMILLSVVLSILIWIIRKIL